MDQLLVLENPLNKIINSDINKILTNNNYMSKMKHIKIPNLVQLNMLLQESKIKLT